MNTWDLIVKGQFEDACHMANEEYEKAASVFPLRNKVYALFLLNKYTDAASLIKYIIKETDGSTDSDFIHLGIALWKMGNKNDAIEMWKKGQKSAYTDAAGGVELQLVLLFAALQTEDLKLKEASLKELGKLSKSKNIVNWPGPLGLFILDKITKDEMLGKIVEIPVLQDRQLCQAYFVLALKELENKNIKSYEECLKKSTDIGPNAYLESLFYLSRGIGKGS